MSSYADRQPMDLEPVAPPRSTGIEGRWARIRERS